MNADQYARYLSDRQKLDATYSADKLLVQL